MRFKLEINMNNAAFDDNEGTECARILAELANNIEDHSFERGDTYTLLDINGNTVGKAEVTK